jgi:hypothetical protein
VWHSAGLRGRLFFIVCVSHLTSTSQPLSSFQVLLRPESQAHVFEFLFSRVPEGSATCSPGSCSILLTFVSCVICTDKNVLCLYDRACQASRYCRARERAFFSNVEFRVDHFHASNHQCSQVVLSSFLCQTTHPLNVLSVRRMTLGAIATFGPRLVVSSSRRYPSIDATLRSSLRCLMSRVSCLMSHVSCLMSCTVSRTVQCQARKPCQES